jgi:CDP-6-deoxy-D-xylo-4-hexulose-3-dehydrase
LKKLEALCRFFTAFEDWFVLPRQTAATRTAWLAVPLVVRDSAPFTRRDLQVDFEAAGVQTRPVFAGNILRHQGFAGIACRTVPGGYPVADSVMRGGILLGCHHAMDEADSTYICDVFRRFAARH